MRQRHVLNNSLRNRGIRGSDDAIATCVAEISLSLTNLVAYPLYYGLDKLKSVSKPGPFEMVTKVNTIVLKNNN